MEYLVQITAVDNESHFHSKKSNPTEALSFLSYYDHEGSSVTITIICDAEEGYNLLRELESKNK